MAPGGWAEYFEWGVAIGDAIFGPDNAGRPVYLDLEEQQLNAIWERTGGLGASGPTRLGEVVRQTLDLATGDVFWNLRARLHQWETTGHQGLPPTMALLASLSLAAEAMTAGDGMASTNYYGRLAQVLLIRERAAAKRLETAYREIAERLWASLNLWLEDEQGDRGLPTAYSVGRNRHIGLPLSQALIRSADRRGLRRFLLRAGLTPGEVISSDEMIHLLDSWLSDVSAGSSANLRRLWAGGDTTMRNRLADVAVLELEGWSHERDLVPTAGPSPPSTSRLLALVHTFLGRRVEFGLEVRTADGNPVTQVVIDAGGDSVEASCLERPGGWLRLQDLRGLPAAALLTAPLRVAIGGDTLAEHRPRAVTVFAKDESSGVYVEHERTMLGADLLILSAAHVAPRVDLAIMPVARPGYQVLRGPEMEGVPDGWTAFAGVQLMASPGSFDDLHFSKDLNVLLPVTLSQTVLGNGFSIPGNIRRWSTLYPPEIRAISGEPGGMVITVHRAVDDAVVISQTAPEGRAMVVPLMTRSLADGDYEIRVAREAGRVLSRRTLRLRSADAGQSQQSPIGTRIETDALWAFRAIRDAEGSDVFSWTIVRPATSLAQLERSPEWLTASSALKPDRARKVASYRASECVSTGAHYLDVEQAQPTSRAGGIVTGTCRYCGLLRRYPATWYAMKAQLRQEQQDAAEQAVARLPPIPVFVARAPTEEDLGERAASALDVLAYLGHGEISSFDTVAAQIDPSPLFKNRFLLGLDDLAHLDVIRDESLSPRAWQARAPTLLQLETGEVMLAGAIGRRGTQELSASVIAAGGTLTEEIGWLGIKRWAMSGVAESRLPDVASAAAGPRGEAISVVLSAGRNLASRIPCLSEIVAAMPAVRFPAHRTFERFDPRTSRWIDGGDLDAPGGYRFQGFVTTHAFRLADTALDRAVIADSRLTRHVAALVERQPLVAYQRDSQLLVVPLGAELPGLFARAAVLCGGRLPTRSAERPALAYRDIPADIASVLIGKLES